VTPALLLAWALTTTAPRHCAAPASALPEASGAVLSDLDPGVVFSHDDSGDSARFVAFDLQCHVVGRWRLPLPEPVDWEDAALGPDHTLVFGDIGDNDAVRHSVQLVTVAEPRIGKPYEPHPVVRVLRYTDGPHDAEGLLVQPKTGTTWVVTKSYSGVAGVYAAAGARLVPVTTLKLGILQPVTGASVRRDGGALVLRTYTDAWIWLVPRTSGGGYQTDLGAVLKTAPVARITLPLEPQGEGVAFTADGSGLILTSEARGQSSWPLDVVPLPSSAAPSATPVPTRAPSSSPARAATAVQPATSPHRTVVIAGVAGAALAAAAAIGTVALTRRRRGR
jgi:hypothetical protein